MPASTFEQALSRAHTMSLNDYLSHKRSAVLARDERIAAGKADAHVLQTHVTAEGRSGVRRLRIREHQIRLEVKVQGRIDPRAGHPGHEDTPIWPHDIHYEVQVQSSASDQQLAALFEAVERQCPILNLLRNPQHIEGRVVRVGSRATAQTSQEAVTA